MLSAAPLAVYTQRKCSLPINRAVLRATPARQPQRIYNLHTAKTRIYPHNIHQLLGKNPSYPTMDSPRCQESSTPWTKVSNRRNRPEAFQRGQTLAPPHHNQHSRLKKPQILSNLIPLESKLQFFGEVWRVLVRIFAYHTKLCISN
jgi:hypothetical protein